jgi:hypothetical protein
MGLPRTFIGFSSTDIKKYWLMLAWKENEKIDFEFADCQLEKEIKSEDEVYIKSIVRKRINLAGKYILLIGEDTRFKHQYVLWETEIAIEKKCAIIGVNLDGNRQIVDRTCPKVIKNIGAIFVPYSPKIIAHAINHYKMGEAGNYEYNNTLYTQLGY